MIEPSPAQKIENDSDNESIISPTIKKRFGMKKNLTTFS